VVADVVPSKASAIIPVAPVNPSVEASPALTPTPSVVNHVNPALQSSLQAQPYEGEPTYTSVADPVKRSASSQQVPHDWAAHQPAAEKVETPPQKPISQVLLDNLKSMWTASASAVQVEQVSNQLTRITPTEPTRIPGELTKQVLVYQPSKIKKNEKL
jgi:hypothetical protein